MIGDDIEVTVLSITGEEGQDRNPGASEHPGVSRGGLLGIQQERRPGDAGAGSGPGAGALSTAEAHVSSRVEVDEALDRLSQP